MSKLTNQEAKGSLTTQSSAEENQNREASSEIVSMTPIDGSPFKLVCQNNEWFVVLGNYRLTEKKQSNIEALEELEKEHWNTIVRVIGVFIEMMENKFSRKNEEI